MRGQVSMRYSQKRWLFFTWTLIPWNFLTLFPAGAVTQVRGRQNRFMGEKYTTSVPHPSVSIVKNWECIRDMYSAINAPTIPTYLLMDSIPSSFPIWKHLQREEGKGKQVKNGRKKERSGRKKGRNSEPERKNDWIYHPRRVFRGLVDVTKECTAHQSERMWVQKQDPALPRCSFLLLGLGCRLCRTEVPQVGKTLDGYRSKGEGESTVWTSSKGFQQSQKQGWCTCARLCCALQTRHWRLWIHSPTKPQTFY